MDRAEFLVKYLVQELVEFPEAVIVNAKVEADIAIISVTVSPSDMGRVIGRGGSVVKAIRTLVTAIGGSTHYSVKIVDTNPREAE